MLKDLFVLKIFKFYPDFFCHAEKRLDEKAWTNFKIYDVTYREIYNCNTHIPNIYRSKDNEAIKFGHLIEYNMRNIFFEIHTQNVTEKLIADPFLKNQN